MKRTLAIVLALLLSVLPAGLPVQALAAEEEADTANAVLGDESSPSKIKITTDIGTLQDPVSVTGVSYPKLGVKIVDMTNEKRTDAGLGSLEWDEDLYNAALIRALEITMEWSHTRPDGTKVDTLTGESVGENLAKGYDTALAATNAWYGSDGHRANILHKQYTRTASACVVQDGYAYWVQLFAF